MRSLCCSLVIFAAACGGKPQAPVTSLPPGTTKPDLGLGSGKIAVSCDATQRANPCDAAPYNLDVAADVVDSCRIRGAQLTLQLKSSDAPGDAVTLDMDNYGGPGSYQLDEPYKRFLRVSSEATAPSCQNNALTGPPVNGTRVVSAPGISCGSPACTPAPSRTRTACRSGWRSAPAWETARPDPRS